MKETEEKDKLARHRQDILSKYFFFLNIPETSQCFCFSSAKGELFRPPKIPQEYMGDKRSIHVSQVLVADNIISRSKDKTSLIAQNHLFLLIS